MDTLQLARAAWPELPSHSLGDLCKNLGLTDFADLAPTKTWHDALYDSLASLALLEHLISEFDLANSPVEILLKPDTSQWHRTRRA